MRAKLRKVPYKLHITALLISVIVGGYSAIHLGQDLNFDLQNYHYDNPYSFLHNRTDKDIAPAQLESYINPIPDIPGYLAISHLKPRAAAGVLGIIQGINIWLVFEITLLLLRNFKSDKRLKVITAAAIAFLSFFGAAATSEIGNTMGDNLVSLFLLPALYLLLYSLQGDGKGLRARTIRLAAYFLAGISVGFKLTFLAFGIGLLFAGLFVKGTFKAKVKESAINIASIIAGGLVSLGYWSAKLTVMFGSPIFPYYNAIFRSQYYPEVNFVDSRWTPQDFGDAWIRPFQFMGTQSVASELPFRDPRIGIAIIVSVLALACLIAFRLLSKDASLRGTWSRPQIAFMVFMGVSYVMWLKQFGYYRYLVPIEMLSLSLIALLVLGVIRKPLFGYSVLAALLLFIVLQTKAIDWGRIPWQPTYFGVTKQDFDHLVNSTVIIAGRAPLGFLLPYFPESSRTIRVDSDLSSPSAGTDAMQKLMKSRIKQRQQAGSKFYTVRADEEKAQADAILKQFGYIPYGCKEIRTYARQSSPSKFRLCTLGPARKID